MGAGVRVGVCECVGVWVCRVCGRGNNMIQQWLHVHRPARWPSRQSAKPPARRARLGTRARSAGNPSTCTTHARHGTAPVVFFGVPPRPAGRLPPTQPAHSSHACPQSHVGPAHRRSGPTGATARQPTKHPALCDESVHPGAISLTPQSQRAPWARTVGSMPGRDCVSNT